MSTGFDLVRGEQYNIGHICTGRQCEAGREDKVALRWISAAGDRSDYTFAELDAQSNQFANVLQNLCVAEQEVIFTDSIPKNKSGKIMRRVLKAGYLGTDAGDISTLESKDDVHP
jgi:acyl-coenzyme A synthetase/AMP-(fatty) acid ligase